MASLNDTLTKREFLEASTLILKPVLNPHLLRSALTSVITKFEVPEGDALLLELLGPGAVSRKRARKKVATDKKEKGMNRNMTAYNGALCWLSDFAANYGRHPNIVKVKMANPTKTGLGIASELFKSIPKEQKDEFCKIMTDFRAEYLAKVEAEGSLSTLKALKKYEAEHPEINIYKILDLEARPEYKTNPAQMRAEAAEARRHADLNAVPAPTATPLGVATKLDFEQEKLVGNKRTLEAEPPGPESASVQKKQKTEAVEVVPMEEEKEEEPEKPKDGEKSEKMKRKEKEEKKDGIDKDKEERKSEKKKKRKEKEEDPKSEKKEKKHKEKKNKEKHDDR